MSKRTMSLAKGVARGHVQIATDIETPRRIETMLAN